MALLAILLFSLSTTATFALEDNVTESEEQQDKVLRAGVFHFPPFVIMEDGEDVNSRMSGADVALLRTVGESLGYKVQFVLPTDGKIHWGTIYSNRTAVGLARDVFLGKVDVGAVEMFNQWQRNKFVDPSEFYMYDYICFVLAKPKPASLWVQLLSPYTLNSWAGIGVCWVASVIYIRYLYRKDKIDWSMAGLIGIGFFITQSVSMTNMRTRVFGGVLCLMGSLLAISYSGTLFSFLAVTSSPKLLKTIEELSTLPPSMKLGNNGIRHKEMLRTSTNPKINKLVDRWEVVSSWREGMRRAEEGDYVFVNGKISSQHVITSSPKDNPSQLYVLNECWSEQQIVLYFPKGSPLRSSFDNRIRYLKEAGLVDKWIEDAMDEGRAKAGFETEETEEKKVLLEEMRPVFIAFSICLFVCLLFFGAEAAVQRVGGMVGKRIRE